MTGIGTWRRVHWCVDPAACCSGAAVNPNRVLPGLRSTSARAFGRRFLPAAPVGLTLRVALGLVLGIALAGCASPGQSLVSAQFCDRPQVHDAAQQDRMLRFAAIVRAELEASGEEVALISRTGINLDRLGVRFSHSGVSLRRDGEVPWSVRQLYYACDERRPRLFDQGIAGFLFNTDDPTSGHVSIVLLPPAAAGQLERTARDRQRALRLLAAQYSANAYPFSVRYQNCNQWVVELLAAAWADLPDGADLRDRAQRWLAENGYAPEPVVLDSHPMKFAAHFMPLIHLDDHPEDDRYGMQMRISLPQTIEAFVRQRLPQARRIEVCHDQHQAVVRTGWQPIAEGCRPAAGDRVIALG